MIFAALVHVLRERLHADTPQNPGSGAPQRERIHDFTWRTWGHDYSFTPTPGTDGRKGRAHGWWEGIRKGDYLVFRGPNGGQSPYRVDSIRYERDPPDMWFATLTHDPVGWLKAVEREAG